MLNKLLEATFAILEKHRWLSMSLGAFLMLLTFAIAFGGSYFLILLSILEIVQMIKDDSFTFLNLCYVAILLMSRVILQIIGVIVFGIPALICLTFATS